MLLLPGNKYQYMGTYRHDTEEIDWVLDVDDIFDGLFNFY